jgi:hypothetical protein
MIENNFHGQQLRRELIRALEMLLAQPSQREEANQVLHTLELEFFEETRKHVVSLDHIVFGSFVSAATSGEVQSDPSVLSALRDELIGRVPYRSTCALKCNLVESLHGDAFEAYCKLKKLLAVVTDRVGTPMTLEDMSEEYTDFRESLYELCYEKLQTHTIAELLVAQGCHVLMTLPDDGSEYIDMEDPFDISTFYSIPDMEAVGPHLKYVESILQKLEGKAILFVDVHLLPSGFVINLR